MTDAKSKASENSEISDAEIVDEAIDEVRSDVFEDAIEDDLNEPLNQAAQETVDHYEDHDERHASLSSRVLTWLAVLLAGAGLALWGGPKLAPQLPEWAAPAAKFLTPGGDTASKDVAALRAEVTEQFENAPKGPTSEEMTALIQNELTELRASTDAKIAALEAQLASADSSNMDARISTVETHVEGVSAELSALTTSVQTTLAQGGTVSEEALAEITTKSAEVEGLRAQLGEMTGQISTLTQRIEDAEIAAKERVEEARAEAAEAQARAAEVVSNSAFEAALDELTAQAEQGVPFVEELNALKGTTNVEIPAEIADNADTGVAALSDLKSQFTTLSHQAIRASVKATGAEDGGSVSKFGAFLKSQVATRSLAPVEGDGTDAILSRMGASLENGDLASVASEAEALPSEASGPLSGWLDDVKTRQSVLDILATFASQPS